MLTGNCLCGAVAFEVEEKLTRVEVCYCSRCQRAYGTGLAATVYARLDRFRWVRGVDAVQTYDAPLLQEPPPYRHVFCGKCGSPLPICREEFGFVEIPVGVLSVQVKEALAYEMFIPRKHPWGARLGSVDCFEGAVPLSKKVLSELR